MEDKKEAGGADAWRTTLGTTKSVPTGNAGGFNKGGSSAAAATKPAEKKPEGGNAGGWRTGAPSTRGGK